MACFHCANAPQLPSLPALRRCSPRFSHAGLGHVLGHESWSMSRSVLNEPADSSQGCLATRLRASWTPASATAPYQAGAVKLGGVGQFLPLQPEVLHFLQLLEGTVSNGSKKGCSPTAPRGHKGPRGSQACPGRGWLRVCGSPTPARLVLSPKIHLWHSPLYSYVDIH